MGRVGPGSCFTATGLLSVKLCHVLCMTEEPYLQTLPAITVKGYQYITTETGLTVGAPKDLSTEEDKHRLAYLQRRFVFTTVDKTGNNICIMCKKYYSATLCITVFLIPSPC